MSDEKRMEPGPEMDWEVCERLRIAPTRAGWVAVRKDGYRGALFDNREPLTEALAGLERDHPASVWAGATIEPGMEYPPVSTDLGAAWLVVEAIEAKEYGKVRINVSHYHGRSVQLSWGPGLHGEGEGKADIRDCAASDSEVEEIPELICRAALRALESEAPR